jgi:hypothetical protein
VRPRTRVRFPPPPFLVHGVFSTALDQAETRVITSFGCGVAPFAVFGEPTLPPVPIFRLRAAFQPRTVQRWDDGVGSASLSSSERE